MGELAYYKCNNVSHKVICHSKERLHFRLFDWSSRRFLSCIECFCCFDGAISAVILSITQLLPTSELCHKSRPLTDPGFG